MTDDQLAARLRDRAETWRDNPESQMDGMAAAAIDRLRTALATAQAERDAAIAERDGARHEAAAEKANGLVLVGAVVGHSNHIKRLAAEVGQEAKRADAMQRSCEANYADLLTARQEAAAAQARVESLERKADEELDAKIRLAKINEQLRDEARWNPLEDYHKRHVPGCRKHIYDQKSSPCSCQTEYDREFVRATANERWANEQLARAQRAEAALAERDALRKERETESHRRREVCEDCHNTFIIEPYRCVTCSAARLDNAELAASRAHVLALNTALTEARRVLREVDRD